MPTETKPVTLLIDDDLVSREIVSTLLSLSGVVVHAAEHGDAALSLLDKGLCAPALILMDARMPGISGLELLEALRSRTHARIVLISASDPSTELMKAADSFLLKPFGIEELNELLSEHKLRISPNGVASPQRTEEADPDIDPEALAQLKAMMPEAAVREIYAALMTDLAQRMTALRTALAAQEKAEIRRIGHAIKGGAASSGARRVSKLGARIEQGGLDPLPAALQPEAIDRNGNPPQLFQELGDAIESLQRMLKVNSLM